VLATNIYKIDVFPKKIGASEVTVEISTNIPGSVDVMLSLGLEGQAPDDVFIGASKRVNIQNGHGVATVGKPDLPNGQYELEVSYYPKWGPQDATARAAGVNSVIETRLIVTLDGSGESAADAQRKENGQRWVMENVYGGTKWNMITWTKKFGRSTPVKVSGLNPNVIKAYYFAQIDMTIFVNDLKGEVSHWRIGRQQR
jgi:hypothetical protein